MIKVTRALKQALESCLDLRIFALLFVPFLLAAVIAVILFFTLGTWWVNTWSLGIEHSAVAQYFSQNLQIADTVSSISHLLTFIIVLLLILPVAYLLAILVVSVFLMPILLRILETKGYATLQKKRGISFVTMVINSFKIGFIYLILFVMTLPLWLIPGGAILIPVLLGSYLNKRIFVYDVLGDFASVQELNEIETSQRQNLYVLGIILGLLNYLVPLTFVVMPVFAGLAYGHFCLNALKELRENRPS